jgi:predicted RNA-binding Zn ribbon-like protein
VAVIDNGGALRYPAVMRDDSSTAGSAMASVTIQLRPETEQKLRQRASRRGASLESYLQELAEREAAADGTGVPADKHLPSFEEMTAPLAEGARSMSEEEVGEFFEGVVRDVRAERRAAKGHPS